MIIEYDPYAVEAAASNLNLRAPNKAAVDAIARALSDAEPGAEIIADLATGVGKTYVAGGLLDYLHETGGSRNVVIVTPGTVIQRKTVANLTPGSAKYLRGLQADPVVITLDDFERGTVASALADPDRMKVFVLTVQSLLRPNTESSRRAYQDHEAVGQALYTYLQQAGDLIVVADEHHVYYSRTARQFQQAINGLQPAALIGLTATPDPHTDRTKIVFHYPLVDAIADGYVKIPVLVGRSDRRHDLRVQLADGVALLNAKAATMRAYAINSRKPYVEPVMFVVAQTIDEANDIRDKLTAPDLLGDPEQVLLVTSEEPDTALAQLDSLENPDSPVRAVVAVNMLREGWDIKNIYVVAAVRALSSQLLTEQILGRGLRLPYGERTGVLMLDTVEVLSHASFSDLLQEANVLLEQAIGDRLTQAQVATDPVPGVQPSPTPVTGTDLTDGHVSGMVLVTLPGPAGGEIDGQTGIEDLTEDPATHVAVGLGTVEDRLQEAEQATEALTLRLTPRRPGGIPLPLFLPRVTYREERQRVPLADIDLVAVEAIGQTFATTTGPALDRRILDAQRDTETGDVHLDIHAAGDSILASQDVLPVEDVQSDLVRRLINANAVESNLFERNAAQAIARAFLTGAGVDESHPWPQAHARYASTSLAEWLQTQQNATPPTTVTETVQVRWPDPLEMTVTDPPANRALITRAADFVRGYPYTGWEKSVYEVAAFHAYSTEFKLGELLDRTPGVKAWVRVTEEVPLRVRYIDGARQREYTPDFVVVDDDDTYWIVEGKANSDMADRIVILKRDAAREWVTTVNRAPNVPQRWAYMLASENAIAGATSWAALRASADTYI